MTLHTATRVAEALCHHPAKSRADVLEAEAIYVDVLAKARIIYGPQHPNSLEWGTSLQSLRRLLAQFQAAAALESSDERT